MHLEVTPWSRTEFFKIKPSVNELIRLHHHLFRHDDFAQVTYAYPFGKDNMANAIKGLIPRKDYEFFLARIQPSNEIIGWIALSFYVEGNEAQGVEKWEAKLEWTEMCSHILKHWKIDVASETSNVWDTIKRASSSLQAKHLPRDYCIINTLVLMPELPESEITNALVKHAIKFWRNRVMLRTEWAIWVQAPHFAEHVYRGFGFKELCEYTVNLGNYGFLPKEERYTFGEYGWKFMILRGQAVQQPTSLMQYGNLIKAKVRINQRKIRKNILLHGSPIKAKKKNHWKMRKMQHENSAKVKARIVDWGTNKMKTTIPRVKPSQNVMQNENVNGKRQRKDLKKYACGGALPHCLERWRVWFEFKVGPRVEGLILQVHGKTRVWSNDRKTYDRDCREIRWKARFNVTPKSQAHHQITSCRQSRKKTLSKQ